MIWGLGSMLDALFILEDLPALETEDVAVAFLFGPG